MISFQHIGQLLPLLACLCQARTILFEHATIIAYNDSKHDYDIYTNASLLINNDRISQLVNSTGMVDIPPNCTTVDATGKIISPGFINTHTHLWQTAYKTLGSNTSLAEYFVRYGEFGPAEQNYRPDDTYLGQLTGSLELIHEGTTTVLDHSHGDFSDETANAELTGSLDSGLRTFYAHTVHEIPNGWPVSSQINLFETWASDARLQGPDAIVELGLAYDAFSSAPEANITALLNITRAYNLSVVTTHYLGGPWANNNSPELLDGLGWMDDSFPVVFSHASFASQTDYSTLRRTNHYISTTPESEQHFGHGHPWSHLIQDQASLGTDCHFTYSGSMVQQARNWMQSLREVNFVKPLINDYEIPVNSPMSVKQAFHLITRAGGLALRRDDLGVIREGAKADIVVFDGTSPNMLGWWDPIAAIMLHSNTGDIEHVVINGNFVKKDGNLVYPDYAGLQKRFLESAKRIQNVWLNTEWEPLTGTYNNLTDYTTAEIVDVSRGKGTGY